MRAISNICLVLSALLTLAFGGWLYLKLEREASLPEGFIGVWAGGYTIIGVAMLVLILGVVLRLVSRPRAKPVVSGVAEVLSSPPGVLPQALSEPPRLTPEPWSPAVEAAPASAPVPAPAAPAPAAPVVAEAPAVEPPKPTLEVPAPTPPAVTTPAMTVVESLASSGGEEFRVVESKPAVQARVPEPARAPEPKPSRPAAAAPVSALPSGPPSASFLQDVASADVDTTAAFHTSPELAQALAILAHEADAADAAADAAVAASTSSSAPSHGLPELDFDAGDVDELFAGLGDGLQEPFSSPSSSSQRIPAASSGPQGAASDLQARLQSLKNQVSAPRASALPDGHSGRVPTTRNKFDTPTRRVPGQEMVSADLLTSGSGLAAKGGGKPFAAGSGGGAPGTPLFMRSVQDIMGDDTGLPSDPFEQTVGGMEPAEANALWREYVEANRRCNRDLTRLKPQVFQDHLERNYTAICKRFDCRSVSFSVKIKEGRVSLQATPVR